ncbi:AAA family ATPase [Streptomyces sp. NBC_01264]|uniref:AAA family ATPase n=1 Tax=Streptomyces sp. NBC_01264 TaxID=2903804 RepID=UPI002253AAEF|nr:MoxR family ATPase [Streptomyces sp. NBC_01264]MCX4776098.1 MoxR family ATPase [Streptomyces sp. NBC_01264]
MTTSEPLAGTSPRRLPSNGGGDDWRLFRGDGERRAVPFPAAPPWRRFDRQEPPTGAKVPYSRLYLIGPDEADVVNAALHLRRPLLVTGQPGTGKSSLAHAVAHELALGRVLQWPVNSRSTLQDALYQYDAVGRLREATLRRDADGPEPDIGQYIRLGALGNALVPRERPRVLLIDELDKGDVDLPNDLLTVFEEGEFAIPELTRLSEGRAEVHVETDDPDAPASVSRGRIRCSEFPIVIITSNGERDFPPAFLRRCVRLDLPEPNERRLREIVAAHLGPDALDDVDDLLQDFLERRAAGELATDQLLNAVFLRKGGVDLDAPSLLRAVLHQLGGAV